LFWAETKTAEGQTTTLGSLENASLGADIKPKGKPLQLPLEGKLSAKQTEEVFQFLVQTRSMESDQ